MLTSSAHSAPTSELGVSESALPLLALLLGHHHPLLLLAHASHFLLLFLFVILFGVGNAVHGL